MEQQRTQAKYHIIYVKLHTYTGETVKILGSIRVDVEYQEQKEKLNLLVVAGTDPMLLGLRLVTQDSSRLARNVEQNLYVISQSTGDSQ